LLPFLGKAPLFWLPCWWPCWWPWPPCWPPFWVGGLEDIARVTGPFCEFVDFLVHLPLLKVFFPSVPGLPLDFISLSIVYL
jgi:hypothetical protein